MTAPTDQVETTEYRQRTPAPGPPGRGPAQTIGTVVLVVALLLLGVGGGWVLNEEISPARTATTVTTTATTAEPATAAVRASDEPVAAVAASLLPTVVQIEIPQGLGSGVIYDSGGLILTAAHVVGPNREVIVRLASGDQVPGTVVGADPASDVAVVRIEADGLVAAPLATDTPLEVGQMAVALGSPYGLAQTVTAGVVSATDRAIATADGRAQVVIQTDASINPGNSGGPLADLDGRVIGINDSIFSRSGGNEGVGFAIPVTTAKEIADRIVAGEPIRTAFLGISGTEPIQGQAGVQVTEVVPGSPAADAGIAVGDLITAIDGQRVDGMVDLAAQIRAHAPGDQVTIEFQHDGGSQDADVTLAAGS